MRDFDPTAAEYISSGYIARSQPGTGFFGDFGSILGAAGSVIGGMAAGDAADAQAGASREQMAESRRQYDQTRTDQAPWRDAGSASINRLAYLLGLGGANGAGSGSGALTRDQIRAQLLPQYTTTTAGGAPADPWGTGGPSGMAQFRNGQMGYVTDNGEGTSTWVPYSSESTSTIDEAGLNAAIEQRLGAQGPGNSDGLYGSLLKKFGVEDFEADPGYAFRQSEGQKGVERSAAARGGLFSGAAGKAMTRFNQDLASQEYGNAYNRFNNDQNNVFNRLAAVSGIGQQAQSQVNAAGQNTSSAVNNALASMGNAQAAGSIGMSNAINSGIGNYNNYNMLNSLINRGSSSGGAGYSGYNPTSNVYFGTGRMGD